MFIYDSPPLPYSRLILFGFPPFGFFYNSCHCDDDFLSFSLQKGAEWKICVRQVLSLIYYIIIITTTIIFLFDEIKLSATFPLPFFFMMTTTSVITIPLKNKDDVDLKYWNIWKAKKNKGNVYIFRWIYHRVCFKALFIFEFKQNKVCVRIFQQG